MSLFPINLVSEIEQYINFSKDTNAALETSVTWADSTHTILKKAPDANEGLPTGTQWAEDTPTGLGDKATVILMGPAADAQFTRTKAWRNFRKFMLEKAVFNFALGHVVTWVAGSPNFTSFDLSFRQIIGGKAKDIIPVQKIATGHAALGASGIQSYIFEEPYAPNMVIEANAFIVTTITMNVVAGSGGTARSEGLYTAFPYSKTNTLKWWSQPGVYLIGRSIE